MSEVLIEYEGVLTGDDGSGWVARACGKLGKGTVWDGWIEFVPVNAGARPVRSRRETTQPSRESLVYWATGLTPVYLKGALDRALEKPVPRRATRRAETLFDGPAPHDATPGPPHLVPHAILDPFDVHAQGEDILIGQLDALDVPRLRDIALAYEIGGLRDPRRATRTELTKAILVATRAAAARV
ncbi:MAG: hypothetical protein ABJB39_02405 [Chloroflexota bacterium]